MNPEAISGLSLGFIFIVTTLNQEFFSTCRMKGHSQYRSSALTWSGKHHTSLDVLLESRIDDYWNVDGGGELWEPWTCFTQFTMLNENKPPNGYMRSCGAEYLWPEIWSSMSKAAQLEEKQQWAIEQPTLDNATKLRPFIPSIRTTRSSRTP